MWERTRNCSTFDWVLPVLLPHPAATSATARTRQILIWPGSVRTWSGLRDSVSLVRVRPETRADWEAIAALTEAAFGKRREARMVDAIRASEAFVPELSLVAEDDGAIVGHVLVSYVELEGAERRLLELGPMSVAPDRQRAGIGSALVRAALRRAGERGEPPVPVLGHPTHYPPLRLLPPSELR